jgi:hypothetical protein
LIALPGRRVNGRPVRRKLLRNFYASQRPVNSLAATRVLESGF